MSLGHQWLEVSARGRRGEAGESGDNELHMHVNQQPCRNALKNYLASSLIISVSSLSSEANSIAYHGAWPSSQLFVSNSHSNPSFSTRTTN